MRRSRPDLEELDLYGLSLLLLLNTILFFFFGSLQLYLVLRHSFMYICRDVHDTMEELWSYYEFNENAPLLPRSKLWPLQRKDRYNLVIKYN